MLRSTITLLAVLIAAPALAQSAPKMPYAYPATVGTSSSQIMAVNPARRRIEFFNPNATAIVAVCPTIARSNSGVISCTVNGPGSITLLPYASQRIDGVGSNPLVPSAWNAIASGANSALTIFEYE